VPLVATEVEPADTVTEITEGVEGEPPEGVVGAWTAFPKPPPQAVIHRAGTIEAKQNGSSEPRFLPEAVIYPEISLSVSYFRLNVLPTSGV